MKKPGNNNTVLISACLLGINCRYDGRQNYSKNAGRFLKGKPLIPFCPEIYGGLGIPREPAEIRDGSGENVLNNTSKVITRSGKDVTENFLHGSREGLKICKRMNTKIALLKEKSPSCGVKRIYFMNRLKHGKGVFAAMLSQNNIEIISSEDV